jgi:DNA-binding transcriptional ArsR family regulator
MYDAVVPSPARHQPAGSPLSEAEAEDIAHAMGAFTTPSRLKLLYGLIGVEKTVEELAAVSELSPNLVSQQLRVLRLLRLAIGRRDGRHMRYRLYDSHVAELLESIRHHGEHAVSGATGGPRAQRHARRRGAVNV